MQAAAVDAGDDPAFSEVDWKPLLEAVQDEDTGGIDSEIDWLALGGPERDEADINSDTDWLYADIWEDTSDDDDDLDCFSPHIWDDFSDLDSDLTSELGRGRLALPRLW